MGSTNGGSMPLPIHLALQGGGAHGALTWGVLDRLLEDGRFAFAAVSGTSAGAMNAVALADGFARGGSEGAREALAGFWEAVGEAARVSPLRKSLRDQLGRTPGYRLFEGLARLAPQGLLNPLGLDPLRAIVAERIDFAAVAAGDIRVHVTATDARTGRPRVFSGDGPRRRGRRRLRLPPPAQPGRRDRRRRLLGRRLQRQPGPAAAPRGPGLPRHPPRPAQPRQPRAAPHRRRHPRPHRRARLRRPAPRRAAHARLGRPQRRPGTARPPHRRRGVRTARPPTASTRTPSTSAPSSPPVACGPRTGSPRRPKPRCSPRGRACAVTLPASAAGWPRERGKRNSRLATSGRIPHVSPNTTEGPRCSNS